MTDTEKLTEELKAFTLEQGASLCGIADLTPYRDKITELYVDDFGDFGCAVSFGVYLPRRVCNEVLEHPTHTYLAYYDIANALLNQIGLKLYNRLFTLGFDAYPIPASQRLGAKDTGIFSHRLAAHLAGLGWIGKSCNLVTEAAGPRLRLGTVLTDAPLLADAPGESKCGSCTLCAEACPAGAIAGKPFSVEDDLSERFDFQKCDAYLTETRQTFGKRICGRCIGACRYGKGE